MRPCVIYGLIDPRTQQLRYVGKTQHELRRRLNEHRTISYGGSKARNQHCAKWLRALHKAGHSFDYTVLQEIPAGGDWEEAEQFWIAYFKYVGANLTNHTAGGDGLCGIRRPKDVYERGAAKRRGKPLSEEAKARMRAAWTPERIAKHRASRKGWRPSEELRALWSEMGKRRQLANPSRWQHLIGINKGKRASNETKEKLRSAWTAERRAMQADVARRSVKTRVERSHVSAS